MKNKKEVAKGKDKILNEIPIFLAKTYRIVDVRAICYSRILPIPTPLSGYHKVMVSLSRVSAILLRIFLRSILSILTTRLLSGSSIYMVFTR